MQTKSPFWLIVLLLLGLAALVPLIRAQQAARGQAAAASSAPPAAPSAQPTEIKRLILRDGSYQEVLKYEVQGDRVRYMSAERYEWEEVPKALIDWPATEQYAREQAASRNSRSAAEIDAETAAERQQEEEANPQVAPGLRLPAQGGVYLLDVYGKQAQLCELAQNSGEVKTNRGRNILRATINPASGQKQSIELQGAHARIQSHVADPFLYVSIEDEPDPGAASNASPQQAKTGLAGGPGSPNKRQPSRPPQDRFRIVRLGQIPKKDVRLVGTFTVSIVGRMNELQTFVPTNVEAFFGPWLKITPAEPLPPGEYALAEMLKDNDMNLYVWDFGVDPKAPANPGAWKPGPASASPSPADPEAPALRTK